MMLKEYRVVLAVWQPAGDIAFDNPQSRSQIADAENATNLRFKGYKTISVVDVTKSTIVLLLKIVVPEDGIVNVSREVSYFSKRLYHDHGWEGLSKVAKRLFTVVEAVEVKDAATNSLPIEPSQVIQNTFPVGIDLVDENYRKVRLKWLMATKELIEIEISMLQK